MSRRNSLENKAKRRAENEAHKAVPSYHEVREDRNKYAPVNMDTFQVAIETDLTKE